MNKNVFDLLVDFHWLLVRKKPSQETIDNARKIAVGGVEPATFKRDKRSYANRLINQLKQRKEDLISWNDAPWKEQVAIYNRAYTVGPQQGVIDALKVVLDSEGENIDQAAKANGVNFQSVKVLKLRFERYNEYSNKLIKLLTKGE